MIEYTVGEKLLCTANEVVPEPETECAPKRTPAEVSLFLGQAAGVKAWLAKHPVGTVYRVELHLGYVDYRVTSHVSTEVFGVLIGSKRKRA